MIKRESGRNRKRRRSLKMLHRDLVVLGFDGSSQLVCVSLGYKYNDEIAAAAAEQLKKLPYMTTFWGLTSDVLIHFTERLMKFMPDGLDHFCFTNGGSESTELSFQLARLYWKKQGSGSKYKIISLHNSYHGTSFGATSATGIFKGLFSSGYVPLVPGFIKAPSNRVSFGPPLTSNREEIGDMLDVLYSVLTSMFMGTDNLTAAARQ